MNIQPGKWASIKPKVLNDKNQEIHPFLVKIKSVDNKNKLIRFSLEDFYNINGEKRVPSKFNTKHGQLKFLDFSPFSWIQTIGDSKKDLISESMKNIRKIIKKIMEEVYDGELSKSTIGPDGIKDFNIRDFQPSYDNKIAYLEYLVKKDDIPYEVIDGVVYYNFPFHMANDLRAYGLRFDVEKNRIKGSEDYLKKYLTVPGPRIKGVNF